MRSLLLSLLVPCALTGQNWPVTMTAEDGPEQLVVLHLRNEYSAPLTAFMAGYRRSEDRQWNSQTIWNDVALSEQQKEGTAPGQVFDVRIAKSPEPASAWKLQAVVFADGTVVGEAEAVNRILSARVQAYHDIERAVPMLTERHASADEFDAWRKDEMRSRIPPAGQVVPVGRPVVPQRVGRLLRDGKTEAEIVQMLNEWRDRLAQMRPAISTKSPRGPGAP